MAAQPHSWFFERFGPVEPWRLLIPLVAAIAVALVVWWWPFGPVQNQRLAQCRYLYSTAKDRADSLRVDRTRVPINPGRGAELIDCAAIVRSALPATRGTP